MAAHGTARLQLAHLHVKLARKLLRTAGRAAKLTRLSCRGLHASWAAGCHVTCSRLTSSVFINEMPFANLASVKYLPCTPSFATASVAHSAANSL